MLPIPARVLPKVADQHLLHHLALNQVERKASYCRNPIGKLGCEVLRVKHRSARHQLAVEVQVVCPSTKPPATIRTYTAISFCSEQPQQSVPKAQLFDKGKHFLPCPAPVRHRRRRAWRCACGTAPRSRTQ